VRISIEKGSVVLPSPQAIDFVQPGDTEYGGADVPLVATASSGLEVSFTSLTPDVCVIGSRTARPVAAGTCEIAADQAGSDLYDAAERVTRTLTVQRAGQTISFTQPDGMTFGDPAQQLHATATSGGQVVLTSLTPAVCTVDETGRVGVLSGGECEIAADPAGDANYRPADQVVGSFTVRRAAQTITFAPIADGAFGDADIPLDAVASSGLPVVFTSLTPTVCDVVDGKVRSLAAGTCQIAADQAGDTRYRAADRVTRSWQVAKAPVVVTTTATSSLMSLLTLHVVYTTKVVSAVTGRPVAGLSVTTRIDGASATTGCTAITDGQGIARCASPRINLVIGTGPYSATVAASSNYTAGVGIGRIWLL
jgi:hypothetical protein